MRGRLAFTALVAAAVLVLGLALSRPAAPATPRLAHGAIELLRVVDAGAAERMPAPPDADDAPFAGTFAVDERDTLYLWERDRSRVLVYEDASLDDVRPEPPREVERSDADASTLRLGLDRRGNRYEAIRDADGWRVDRVSPRGDRLAEIDVPRDAVPLWDLYLREDGAVFAITWRTEDGVSRLSLYRLLSAPRG